jgi:hypothetical protein
MSGTSLRFTESRTGYRLRYSHACLRTRVRNSHPLTVYFMKASYVDRLGQRGFLDRSPAPY